MTNQTKPNPAQAPDAQPVTAAQTEVLYADRSFANESAGKEMAACLAKDGQVECYFPTLASAERNGSLFASAPALLAERDGYRQALETEKMLRAADVRELRAALETILEGAAPQGRETWTLADVIQDHYRIARAALEGGAK